MSLHPAILLRAGKPAELCPEFDNELASLHAFVGGPCYFIGLNPDALAKLESQFRVKLGDRDVVRLVVHDDGIARGLPLNALASEIYGRSIFGDALVVNAD